MPPDSNPGQLNKLLLVRCNACAFALRRLTCTHVLNRGRLGLSSPLDWDRDRGSS
jgi:hypothetical protein